MSWLRRHVAWLWPAAILAVVALVVILRMTGDGAGPASLGAGTEHGGVVAGEPGDLAAAADRMRLLQGQVARTREQLASMQAEIASRRQQITTLSEMLSGDSLTECPVFLQEDTTVRALQKIIREATSAADSGAGQDRLNTAATVARERLRRKLELLRDQLTREISDLDGQAEALRQRLHLESEEMEHLQREVQRQLQGRLPAPPIPAA